MWLIDDLRNFDNVDSVLFKKRAYVDKILNYELFKTESANSIKYGLYHDDILISYIWFTKVRDGLMTYEFHTRDPFKNKGLGYLVYKFVMTKEKHTIITDHMCSSSGTSIWKKLKDDPEIETGMYSTITNTIHPIDSSLFGNDEYHMIAKAIC